MWCISIVRVLVQVPPVHQCSSEWYSLYIDSDKRHVLFNAKLDQLRKIKLREPIGTLTETTSMDKDQNGQVLLLQTRDRDVQVEPVNVGLHLGRVGRLWQRLLDELLFAVAAVRGRDDWKAARVATRSESHGEEKMKNVQFR